MTDREDQPGQNPPESGNPATDGVALGQIEPVRVPLEAPEPPSGESAG